MEARRKSRVRQEHEVRAPRRAGQRNGGRKDRARSTASSGSSSRIRRRRPMRSPTGEIDMHRNARLRAVPVVEDAIRTSRCSSSIRSAGRITCGSIISNRPSTTRRCARRRWPRSTSTMFLQAQVGVPGAVSHLLLGLSLQDALRHRRRAWTSSPSRTRSAPGICSKESGYDGTPVVLLQPTDVAIIAKLPVVAAQLLRQAGFIVDMQSMNWQSLVSRQRTRENRLAHLHHEFTGRLARRSHRQFLAQRRLRQGVVWLALRRRNWRGCATPSPAPAMSTSARPWPSRCKCARWRSARMCRSVSM